MFLLKNPPYRPNWYCPLQSNQCKIQIDLRNNLLCAAFIWYKLKKLRKLSIFVKSFLYIITFSKIFFKFRIFNDPEAGTGGVLQKKVLLEILQNS